MLKPMPAATARARSARCGVSMRDASIDSFFMRGSSIDDAHSPTLRQRQARSLSRLRDNGANT
jgi:hypothetical protein